MSLNLFFLHGFSGNSNDWSAISSQFTERSFCLDLPYHGQNQDPKWEVNFETTAHWFTKELEKQGMQKCIPIGYSMGGRLALYFALKYPKKCQALILESSNFGIEDLEERIKRFRDDCKLSLALAEDLLAENDETLREQVLEKWFRDWYDKPLFATLSNQQKEALIQSKKYLYGSMVVKGLSAFSLGVMPYLGFDLKKLTMPVLLISGEKDLKYTRIMQQMQREIPNAKHVALNAGHNVHLENPEAYTAAVKIFLSELP